MIIRAALMGLVLWFAAFLAFRLAGDMFFYPDPNGQLLLLVAVPIAMVALGWLCMRLLGVRRGDEAEAAVALALPGMGLDAYAAYRFVEVFPNLDPMLDGAFGALMLAGYGALIFAGLLFTRLQPEDERL